MLPFQSRSILQLRSSTTNSLRDYKPLTLDEVKKHVAKLSSTICLLDPFPTNLVKQHTELLPLLAHIINISLLSGKFPSAWKNALITPMLKKPRLDPSPVHFRLISHLPYIAAVVNSKQHCAHCIDNGLFPTFQSAYRKDIALSLLY